jgi:hypothetical protein
MPPSSPTQAQSLRPGLRILTAAIDRQGATLRLRIRTHCAQVFDLILAPKMAEQTGASLFAEARRLQGDETAILAQDMPGMPKRQGLSPWARHRH